MGIKALKRMLKVNVTSARRKDIMHMNANPRAPTHIILMLISKTIKSLGIELMNVNPSITGQLII